MRTNLAVSVAAGAAMVVAIGCTNSNRTSRTLIQNKGSDTLVNVAQAWAEHYRDVRPEVAVAVSGGGSGTGIAALINGTVDIANASRSIKDEEREAIRKNQGAEAVEHVVAIDAVVFFVHKDNPLDTMSLEQLACIYAEGGKCESWGSVGAKVPTCAGQEVIRVSRQSNSGTYAFVREKVLGKEVDFKLGSRDMQGNKDVVDLVSHTPCAIGYSGLAYANDSVKALCISNETGGKCIRPSVAAAKSGEYVLARPLFMYTLGEAKGATREYLDWILSDAGQKVVADQGFVPIR